MRVLAATLAVLLFVAISSWADADLSVSTTAAIFQMNETKPTFCCFAYIPTRIPLSIIRSAHRTSSICTMQAVVLVTRKGNMVCADPKAYWVQGYLKHLEVLQG